MIRGFYEDLSSLYHLVYADWNLSIARQALGLAALGYDVTGSDLRNLHGHHGRAFDLVIACDNAIPHLLADADILTAVRLMEARSFQPLLIGQRAA